MAEPSVTGGTKRIAEAEQLRTQLAAALAQVEKLTAALREQEVLSRRVEHARQAWAQTVDALAQPIFMHDENGSIVRANRAYADRAGVSVKNLIGKVYWKLFPQQEAPFKVPDDGADQADFEFALSPDEVFLVRSAGASSGLPPGWRLFIFQDITALKNAEAAARSSGQYARSMVESSLAMIVAVDRDRRIIEFNPAAERAFGYTREEALGRHVDTLYADPESGEIVRRLVFERQGMVGEIENKRKSGEVFTSLMSAAVLRDDEGRALGILGASLDISERKRAEGKLREALAEREVIFDNITAGIVHAKDRVIRRVNRRFAEMVGYAPEELVGQSTEIVYPSKEDYEKLGREAYPELARGNAYQSVVRFKRKDGSLVWVYLSGRAVDREQGGTNSVWVCENVTDRKAAEDELQRREARFRALVEGSGDMSMVFNAAGVIRYESPGMERLLGYRPEERIGRSSFEFVHPDDLVRVRDGYQRILRGEARYVRTEFRARHRDGAWRVVESVNGGAFELEGEKVGVLSLRDVTDRRRNEQRLLLGLEGTIAAIAAAAEMRDAHAAGHQRGAAGLAVAIARELGLDEVRIRGLHLAGIVHDVGQIRIPAEILARPSRLSEAEYALVKTHAQAGYDILKNVDMPWPIAEIVLQHHESLDGSGYPRGLKGDAIMLEARILTVADVVEAMVSHRSYRAAHGIDAALAEITNFRGTKFDPQAVDACLRLFREKGYTLDKR